MDNLRIAANLQDDDFPAIDFNVSTGVLKMAGQSYMAESIEFYKPIMDWLREYLNDTTQKVDFIISIVYFNTSSSKHLMKLFYLVNEFINRGGEAKVTWFLESEDEDFMEDIEDLTIITGVQIDYIIEKK